MVSRRNNDKINKVQTATDSLAKILKNLNKNHNEPYISLTTATNSKNIRNNIDNISSKKKEDIPVVYYDLRANYLKYKNIQNKNSNFDRIKLANQDTNKHQIQSSDSDIAFDTNDVKKAVIIEKLKYGTITSNDIKKASITEKLRYGNIVSLSDIKNFTITKNLQYGNILPSKAIKCILDDKNKPNYKKEIALPQNLDYKKLFDFKSKKITNFKNNTIYYEDLNKKIENEKKIIASIISKIDNTLSGLGINNTNNKILQDLNYLQDYSKKNSENRNYDNIKYPSSYSHNGIICKKLDSSKPSSCNIKINNIKKFNKDNYQLI